MFHTIYVIITMFVLPTVCCMVENRKRKVVGVDICKWYIFWTIGFRALTTGAMQFLNSSYTMELLQVGEESKIIIMELGFAQFGIGLIGILSLWEKSFRVPTIITYGIFMLGASMIHITRFTTANAEEIVSLAGDLFVLVIAVVYFVQYQKKKRSRFTGLNLHLH